MTAYQRGKVTVRQERGFGPISFKRLLISGGVAVLLTMTLGRFLGPMGSCLAGAAALALLLAMTQPREGMPTFVYLLASLRGALIAATLDSELGGVSGALARLLRVHSDEGIVHSAALFEAPVASAAHTAEDDWIFLDTTPDQPGLERVTAPLTRNDHA